MASQSRSASAALALEQALRSETRQFSFYQAIRLLECAYPAKPRLGHSRSCAEDRVRLAQEPSLAFASSSLASFNAGKQGLPPRLSVNFFGLFGPNGPLPLHITELARDRLRHSDDPTFSRFADLFHHRMLSLFYRAWADTQPAVQFDRPQQDRFSAYIGSLSGLGMASLADGDAMPDLAKHYYVGRLSDQRRNAEGLVAMLAEFFNIPASLQQFVGEWLELPEACLCRLGRSPQTGTLGESATLGCFAWTCQQKFRVIIGPMSLQDYQGMLPGGENRKRLRAMVRNYVGDSLNWDVNLLLKKAEVPPLTLGESCRLGWTSWLGRNENSGDAADLILDPQ